METSEISPVWFKSDGRQHMADILSKSAAYDKIFVLCDTNTEKFCLPYLKELFKETSTATVLVIAAGEKNKTTDQAQTIWQKLIEHGATRQSLLINLGGGMITDIGAFIATLFKRGMPYIHIPTTLLAMTDAAIGGKNAVNVLSYKNQAGTFSFPVCTYVDTAFLKTLSENELKNGFAEMLKHGIIYDKNYFMQLAENGHFTSEDAIRSSVEIKSEIVKKDKYDRAERKILNFGHTIGHALESMMAANNNEISHGVAVAAGMICESHLAVSKKMLAEPEAKKIEETIRKYFSFEFTFTCDSIRKYLWADKKNSAGQLKFSLPEKIGKCSYDISVEESSVINAINKFTIPEISNAG